MSTDETMRGWLTGAVLPLCVAAVALCVAAVGAGCSDDAKSKVGDTCQKDDECTSGRCDDALCKAANPFGLGELCQNDYECKSEKCANNVCVQGTGKTGQGCSYWEQCVSGQCQQGLCVDRAPDAGPDVGTPDGPRPSDLSPDVHDAGVDLAVDMTPTPDIKVLDFCEKMAQAEGLTCKPMGNQTITGPVSWTAGCYQLNSLTIDSAGTLTLETDAIGKLPTTLIVKQLTIEAGAVIHSDHRGYPQNAGPGRGWTTASSLGSGAGHGGLGGPKSGNPAGSTYGDLMYPILAGSGGGNGGSGGGAIRICAATKMTVDGYIRVLGANGTSGGSGGSILLLTPLLEGSGTLDASGGVSTGPICGAVGGGGGGGRIALRATTNTFSGPTKVNGGTTTCYSGAPSGQPGTVQLGKLP